MRKRLIGKAFAIAMSGAMVLTATPVTANIFNVAHIVKAADEVKEAADIVTDINDNEGERQILDKYFR